jgi:hypothetical protein
MTQHDPPRCTNPACPHPNPHGHLPMPDPEVGTRIDWIRFKLGTGPEPGSPAWEAEQNAAPDHE